MIRYLCIVLIFSVFFLLSDCQKSEHKFDLLIQNGFIVDGSGNPWYKADIGIKDSMIVHIGCIDSSKSRTKINAQGFRLRQGYHVTRRRDKMASQGYYEAK